MKKKYKLFGEALKRKARYPHLPYGNKPFTMAKLRLAVDFFEKNVMPLDEQEAIHERMAQIEKCLNNVMSEAFKESMDAIAEYHAHMLLGAGGALETYEVPEGVRFRFIPPEKIYKESITDETTQT